jgi:Transglycosylase
VRRVLVAATVCVAAAGLLVPSYLVLTRYVPYRAGLQSTIADARQAEGELSPATVRLLHRVYSPWRRRSLAARHALTRLGLDATRAGEWHLRFTLWSICLPLEAGDSVVDVLVAAGLPHEHGHGLRDGARRYFGKPPEALTDDELLTLLAIAKAPRHLSPTAHPEQQRQREVERLRNRRPAGT